MKNILEEITRLRLKRNWSEYELAQRSKISQSTISTWYRKNQIPTIFTLEKVCSGLGITLSQFFAESEDLVALNKKQAHLIDSWSALNSKQQQIILDLVNNMNGSV